MRRDKQIFRLVYGDKSADLLEQADEKTISLATFCVSDKDFQIIMEATANKLECECFAKKYHPSKIGVDNEKMSLSEGKARISAA